jgi:hypothetical protein
MVISLAGGGVRKAVLHGARRGRLDGVQRLNALGAAPLIHQAAQAQQGPGVEVPLSQVADLAAEQAGAVPIARALAGMYRRFFVAIAVSYGSCSCNRYILDWKASARVFDDFILRNLFLPTRLERDLQRS